MVKRLLPLVLIPLAGCALTPSSMPPARPVTVDVPVAEPVYCTPPPLPYPDLPIAKLMVNSPPADTIRAYAATVVVLKGVVREREAVIGGCAAPASPRWAATEKAAAPSPEKTSRRTKQTQRSGEKIR